MSKRPVYGLALAALLTAQASAGQEAFEQVVVRNRTFTVGKRLELSLDAATALQARLVDTYNFNAGVAYNLTESWALEARGGYAISKHSSLADNVAHRLLLQNPTGDSPEVVTVNDLSGLWEMKANLIAGVRWAPIYGKVSLMGDSPVHYQAYLWLGGGIASLHRQSVVECVSGANNDAGTCGGWLKEDRAAGLGSVALGTRFFLKHHGAIKVEVRDYVYRDRYPLDVDRSVAQSGGTTGRNNPSPGFTNLVMIDLGFTFFL